MTTRKQICLQDQLIRDGDKELKLERGQEYITSVPCDGEVTVYSSYWTKVPEDWFGGAVPHTE